MNRRLFTRSVALSLSALTLSLGLSGCGKSESKAGGKTLELLNVSYDPTREFYREYNDLFVKHWKEKSGQEIAAETSHGGSGKQARAVIDGVEADVLTLALAGDIDKVSKAANLLPADWQTRLPEDSSPYTSTIVLLVREGNPKGIKDWDDLVREDVEVITPNPKTSGGAQWNFLAAYEYARRKYGSDDAAKDFISKLYKNVPVLDTGARGSTTTFVERKIGDVFISWENEAFLAKKEFGEKTFEIVVPSISILAQPAIALVDKNVDKKGSREPATEYLNFLYSDAAQDLAGKHFFRPTKAEFKEKYSTQFPQLELFTINEVFGGWTKVHEDFFADGKLFDQIYTPSN